MMLTPTTFPTTSRTEGTALLLEKIFSLLSPVRLTLSSKSVTHLCSMLKLLALGQEKLKVHWMLFLGNASLYPP